jgi:Mg2+ and Co2+ transporter CorA
MNEVMKVMAIVTCLNGACHSLLAGFFGMNFERIPLAKNDWALSWRFLLWSLIPVGMLFIFKRRGWF